MTSNALKYYLEYENSNYILIFQLFEYASDHNEHAQKSCLTAYDAMCVIVVEK